MQRSQHHVFTHTEASVLSRIGEDAGATFPELSSTALLTPAEVSGAVRRLTSSGLVSANGGKFVHLTQSGAYARRALLRGSSRVFVLPDDVAVRSDAELLKGGSSSQAG